MVEKPVIGVVGLGTMGLGIAQVYAAAGFAVAGWDATASARDAAKGRIAAALEARVKAGKLAEAERQAVLGRITLGEGLQDLAAAALVIEAIVEEAGAKQELLRGVEALAPGAVLATNTSSIPVARIAGALRDPSRLLALHFFNPAPAMKLVELAGHAGTAPDAVALARKLTEAAGKTVIQCPDRPGFIVNRCARPYYGEALAMLEEATSPARIDAAMRAAGYRLGPFALIDLIGADVNLAATEGMSAAMAGHPRYHAFAALKAQLATGDLGRKTGRGFLFPQEVVPTPDDALVLRIEATLANEAGWLAGEGVAPDDIDTAVKLGLNFPRGPIEALRLHGRDRVLAELARLEATAPPHLKTRYLPAPFLVSP